MRPSKIIQGDLGPFAFLLEDDKGPVLLPPGTVVQWLMGPLRPDVVLPRIVAGTAVLDDGTPARRGRGQWIPAAGQTDTPGVYGVQFRAIFPSGPPAVFPSGDPEELIIRALVA